MQFKLFLAIFAAAAPVLAAPAAEIVDRAPQVDGYLYVCIDANWGSPCQNIPFVNNQCTEVPAPYFDQLSSWGPQKGWWCYTYVDSGCKGVSLSGQNPGYASLPAVLNDAISSFICYRE